MSNKMGTNLIKMFLKSRYSKSSAKCPSELHIQRLIQNVSSKKPLFIIQLPDPNYCITSV